MGKADMQRQVFAKQKQALIEFWQTNNIIKDKRCLLAFKSVPREAFVLPEYIDEAYDDRALPIVAGQTISQPTTVMIMTQALEVKRGMKILEVGTGSGYQAALLSKLVGSKGIVYTTEIIHELVDYATLRLRGYRNVKVIETDGSVGLQEYAPYDRIIVTAASPDIPKPLLEQLKQDGILVIPVGNRYVQQMLKVRKDGSRENLGDFVFVPLKGRYGF